MLVGVLTYNVPAALLLLAFAGAGLKIAGIVPWPAVVYHMVLPPKCVARRIATRADYLR